jgi:O-antigen/teichoic acid export membrane protein
MSVGLPVLLLTHFFGLAVTGAFSIALRLLQAPINFILAPLRQVLFQKATELHNHSGDIRKLYNLSTSYLFAICIIPTVLLFCFAPPIFSLILGDQWRVAGEYGRWMSLWLLSSVCKLPSDLLGRILRKQGIMLILEVATLVVRVFTIIAGSVWLTASGTVAAFSVISCATNITLIVVVARAVKKHNPLSVNT